MIALTVLLLEVVQILEVDLRAEMTQPKQGRIPPDDQARLTAPGYSHLRMERCSLSKPHQGLLPGTSAILATTCGEIDIASVSPVENGVELNQYAKVG